MSDLLDERLRRLQHQLEESNKSCEGLVNQVEAFNRTAREVQNNTTDDKHTWHNNQHFLSSRPRTGLETTYITRYG